MSCALISGTFDPITLGHLDIISRSSKIFDRVIVAVMNNLNKESLFSLQERERLVRLSCQALSNVEVLATDAMMVEFFDKVSADVIVRGIRNEKDASYEFYMAEYLHQHNTRIETVFLSADPSLEGISSSAVREELKNKRIPYHWLPEAIWREFL